MSENEDVTCQKLRDTVKAVLREKIIAINAYIKIEKTLSKQKIRVEINKAENRKIRGKKINEAISLFFLKINKINKP